MKHKKIIISLLVVVVAVAVFAFVQKKVVAPVNEQIQEAVYKNASADLIVVDLPFPGAVTGKEFEVRGKARGTWYFEASFPIAVLDKNGTVLWQGPAQAQSDWMTEDFVSFKVTAKVSNGYIGPATLILKNDNPSGMPENEKSISFPITIEY